MESYGLFFSALMLLAFILSARGGLSSVETGLTDSSLPGYLSFNYARFQGVKKARIRMDRKDVVKLYYNVEVDAGKLIVLLKDPSDGIIWEKAFIADAADTVTLKPERPGNYQLLIEGRDTGGGFDIQWNIDEI